MQFLLKKLVGGADGLKGWVGSLRSQKRLGSQSLCLTPTQHTIFIKKKNRSEGWMCQSGGWTPFACKKVLDTPSLNATLTGHAIFR